MAKLPAKARKPKSIPKSQALPAIRWYVNSIEQVLLLIHMKRGMPAEVRWRLNELLEFLDEMKPIGPNCPPPNNVCPDGSCRPLCIDFGPRAMPRTK